jgi:DNA-binding response OmpR family regulator
MMTLLYTKVVMLSDMKKKKILLVEDDVSLADIYRTRFEAEGFEVIWVSDGEQSLVKAMEIIPDLIIMDIMMPKIDGFNAIDILKNTDETKDVVIIAVSALSQPSDINRAKQLGADDFLVKSQVNISDVVSKIKKLLA